VQPYERLRGSVPATVAVPSGWVPPPSTTKARAGTTQHPVDGRPSPMTTQRSAVVPALKLVSPLDVATIDAGVFWNGRSTLVIRTSTVIGVLPGFVSSSSSRAK